MNPSNHGHSSAPEKKAGSSSDHGKKTAQASGPKEKEFGSHSKSNEARPGDRDEEWKSPSNR